MIAEAFREFRDAAFVKSIRLRAILVVLHNQRIHKAWLGIAGQALRATRYGVGRRRRGIPVAIGNRLAVGQRYRGKRRRQQIGVDRNREVLGVRIDAAERK